jgi:hypothetical protein
MSWLNAFVRLAAGAGRVGTGGAGPVAQKFSMGDHGPPAVWFKIDDGRARGVIGRTGMKMEGLSEAARLAGTADASKAGSPLVAGAIGAFFESRHLALRSLTATAGEILDAGTAVLDAHRAGDEEMAAQQQAAAARASSAQVYR